MNIGEIIFLNLEKTDLFGWERIKSASRLARMVRDILKGDEFPPVYITTDANDRLVLSAHTSIDAETQRDNYGGHHRALAHYIAGKPLKCMFGTIIERSYMMRDINIKDIKIK